MSYSVTEDHTGSTVSFVGVKANYIGGIVKKYLRELSNPVIPVESYKSIIAAAGRYCYDCIFALLSKINSSMLLQTRTFNVWVVCSLVLFTSLFWHVWPVDPIDLMSAFVSHFFCAKYFLMNLFVHFFQWCVPLCCMMESPLGLVGSWTV